MQNTNTHTKELSSPPSDILMDCRGDKWIQVDSLALERSST